MNLNPNIETFLKDFSLNCKNVQKRNFKKNQTITTYIQKRNQICIILNGEADPKSAKLLKFVLDDGTDTDRVILSGIHPFYEPEELIGKTLVAITNLPPRKMMGIESNGMLLSAIHQEEGEEKLNLLMVSPRIPAGAKLY